ncbi:MAG: PPOX class F420-dependent oxidoreductase [Actinomycetota bacterium]
MTEKEWHDFLAVGTRTGKLATTRKDGRPHVAPIWFVLDDNGTIVLTTGATSVKGRNLQRDSRAALAVEEQAPPYPFVIIDGEVALSEDLDDLLLWSTRIAERYVGPDKAEAFGRRNAVPGELLVRLTPRNVVALDGAI